MPQQIKLSPNVLLLLTDEVDSIDLNTTDIYINNHGSRKQLLFEDGEIEERTNSFGLFENGFNGFERVLLTPTPNYFPETRYNIPTFHTDSLLSNQLVAPLSSNLDFIKCKLMFSSGYGYNPNTNALQSLSIQYRGNNGTVDLLNIFDDFTSSKIVAADREIVLDGTIFNTMIEFRLLSVARLQSMTAPDSTELNTLLFGTDTPEVLHVEYTNMPSDGIIPFTESSLSFTKLVPQIINNNTLNVSFENNDIDIEVSQTDGVITFRMIHTRFNLESYLTAQSFNFGELVYELTLTQYDVGGNVVGTTSLFLKNLIAPFNTITHHPTNLNPLTDHISVDITGRLITLEGATIQKLSSLVITDVTPLQGVMFDVEFEEYSLVNNVTQNISTAQTVFDAPTIVEVEKPIYVQSFGVNSIDIYPVKQVIDIKGVYNKTLSGSVEFEREYSKKNVTDATSASVTNPLQNVLPSFTILQIKNKQYRNISGSIFRYEIDEYAHGENARTYIIVDPDNRMIVSGGVNNIKV